MFKALVQQWVPVNRTVRAVLRGPFQWRFKPLGRHDLLEILQENSDALGAHVPRVSVAIVDKSATRHEPTHTAMPWNSSWSRHSGRTADSRSSQVPQTWPSVDPWQTSQAESDVQQQPLRYKHHELITSVEAVRSWQSHLWEESSLLRGPPGPRPAHKECFSKPPPPPPSEDVTRHPSGPVTGKVRACPASSFSVAIWTIDGTHGTPPKLSRNLWIFYRRRVPACPSTSPLLAFEQSLRCQSHVTVHHLEELWLKNVQNSEGSSGRSKSNSRSDSPEIFMTSLLF